jgi:hypothetical protein
MPGSAEKIRDIVASRMIAIDTLLLELLTDTPGGLYLEPAILERFIAAAKVWKGPTLPENWLMPSSWVHEMLYFHLWFLERAGKIIMDFRLSNPFCKITPESWLQIAAIRRRRNNEANVGNG